MHIDLRYKSQIRPCWAASSAIYTIQFEHNCAQQCLIQADVEQLLGAPSVHSFTLVFLISSQLLLKATDLDWVQDNSSTIEAVDNIHLLKHVQLKAYLYNDNIEHCQVQWERVLRELGISAVFSLCPLALWFMQMIVCGSWKN